MVEITPKLIAMVIAGVGGSAIAVAVAYVWWQKRQEQVVVETETKEETTTTETTTPPLVFNKPAVVAPTGPVGPRVGGGMRPSAGSMSLMAPVYPEWCKCYSCGC